MESNPYLVGDEPTQEVEDEVSPVIWFVSWNIEFNSLFMRVYVCSKCLLLSRRYC